jgi:aspartate aminotransferase-like enzyme
VILTRTLIFFGLFFDFVQVREIAALARDAGVDFVFVDGAHAPGQLDLRLDDLGCDAYVTDVKPCAMSRDRAAVATAVIKSSGLRIVRVYAKVAR